MRILGYNVCDVLDSAHTGIVKIWLDYINGEHPIEDVIKAYHDHGFGSYIGQKKALVIYYKS